MNVTIIYVPTSKSNLVFSDVGGSRLVTSMLVTAVGDTIVQSQTPYNNQQIDSTINILQLLVTTCHHHKKAPISLGSFDNSGDGMI